MSNLHSAHTQTTIPRALIVHKVNQSTEQPLGISAAAFYIPDALPVAQPTALNHQMTEIEESIKQKVQGVQ